MAKKKTTEAVVEEAAPKVAAKSDRQARWEAYLELARPQNPVIFDMQKANGEFDKIPESFV